MRFLRAFLIAACIVKKARGEPPSRGEIRAFVDGIVDKGNLSIVVIGAHAFGGDVNDPLYNILRQHPWHSALLVEASPPIALALGKETRAQNPLPKVREENIS